MSSVALATSCSNAREDAERDAERAVERVFNVAGKVSVVDVDSKTGVIKLEGPDAKYVKGEQQPRPIWLPDGLPLPPDLVIDVSAQIRTQHLISSVRGMTKMSVAALREMYASSAAALSYRVVPDSPNAAVPDREVVLLAYTKSGDPLDIRLAPDGTFEVFFGRFW